MVVSAAGDHLAKAVNGGGAANPVCANRKAKETDPTENARSVGVLISLGKFRFLDLGDLTWNKENELVCPNNLLGSVDLYLTTHHGMDASGPETVVHGIRPRVALEKQSPDDLIWIRNDFLMYDDLHPRVIVHGHTPVERPDIRDNRVNIDTRAYETARLTALVVEGTHKRFLTT